jgi:hypothetical protein
MKIQGLVLLIASMVLNDGLAHASLANRVLQLSSQDSTGGSSHSNDAMHATPGQGSDQKEATRTGERAAGRHHSNKSYVRRQVRLPTPSRPKPARNGRAFSRAEGPSHVERPALGKPRVVTARIANARAPAIRPPAGSAIGGQQLRHSHNLAAIPVALDGAANARRNTQAINGSEIHLRH